MHLKKLKKAMVLVLSCAVLTGSAATIYAADDGSDQTATEETDTSTDTETDTSTDTETDTSADTETDTTTDTETDTTTDTETDTTTDTETDTTTDTETDTTADTETDTSADADTDGETTDDSSGEAAEAVSITSASAELTSSSYTYDGSAKQPTAVVSMNGTVLTEGTDYTLSYSNNINAGLATVTITGTGSYTGTLTRYFQITAAELKSATLATKVYIYDGTEKKPEVTVKNAAGTVLTKGTDYTVTYTRKKAIGTSTVTIKGKGNYAGSTITKTYKIKPGQVSLTGAESLTKKKLTVSWNSIGGNAKYQIAYKVKGTGTFKYKTVSKAKVKATVNSLKSGKVYKVKVRAVRTVGGVTYNGAWSSAMFVTVK